MRLVDIFENEPVSKGIGWKEIVAAVSKRLEKKTRTRDKVRQRGRRS